MISVFSQETDGSVLPGISQTIGFDGGVVVEESVIVDGGLGLDRTNSLLLSQTALRVYFSFSSEIWSFSGRGVLGISVPLGIGDVEGFSFLSPEPTVSGDVNLFVLDGNLPLANSLGFSALSLRFGRFTMAETSTAVFRQTLDGIGLNLIGNSASLGVFLGYNGFLHKGSSRLNFTPGDFNDQVNSGNWFASPRVVYGLTSGLGGDNDLKIGLDMVYQGDLRGLIVPERVIQPGTVNPDPNQDSGLYWTVHIINQFQYTINPFSYLDLVGIFQSGQSLFLLPNDTYDERTIIAGKTRVSMTLFPLPRQRISISGGWASGDGEYRNQYNEGAELSADRDFIHLYKPLTTPDLGVVFTPAPGNLVWADVQWGGRPLGNSTNSLLSGMQVSVRGLTFFRGRKGPISDSRMNVSANNPYLGSELGAGISFRPLSDLGFGLNGGIFLPATFGGGIFENSAPLLEYLVSGFLSLRF